jgi:predicted transcriptional regulator
MKTQKKNKKPSCLDILNCVSDLNHSDVEVYQVVKNDGKCDVEHVAKKLNKERSTIYRSLQRLSKSGLCIKKTKTLTKGGYYHVYSCNELTHVKNEMRSCIDEWYEHMKETLDGK